MAHPVRHRFRGRGTFSTKASDRIRADDAVGLQALRADDALRLALRDPRPGKLVVLSPALGVFRIEALLHIFALHLMREVWHVV